MIKCISDLLVSFLVHFFFQGKLQLNRSYYSEVSNCDSVIDYPDGDSMAVDTTEYCPHEAAWATRFDTDESVPLIEPIKFIKCRVIYNKGAAEK